MEKHVPSIFCCCSIISSTLEIHDSHWSETTTLMCEFQIPSTCHSTPHLAQVFTMAPSKRLKACWGQRGDSCLVVESSFCGGQRGHKSLLKRGEPFHFCFYFSLAKSRDFLPETPWFFSVSWFFFLSFWKRGIFISIFVYLSVSSPANNKDVLHHILRSSDSGERVTKIETNACGPFTLTYRNISKGSSWMGTNCILQMLRPWFFRQLQGPQGHVSNQKHEIAG